MPTADLIKKFGTKRCCAFLPPLTPKMYMMPEHGQQNLNKGKPSNVLETPLYMVSSLTTTANFLIYSRLQFPTKVCSNQRQGIERLLIWNGLFSFKISLVEGSLPHQCKSTSALARQTSYPKKMRCISKDGTNHCWAPTFSLYKPRSGGQHAWLMLRSQLRNTDVQQDEAPRGGHCTPSSSTTGHQSSPYR